MRCEVRCIQHTNLHTPIFNEISKRKDYSNQKLENKEQKEEEEKKEEGKESVGCDRSHHHNRHKLSYANTSVAHQTGVLHKPRSIPQQLQERQRPQQRHDQCSSCSARHRGTCAGSWQRSTTFITATTSYTWLFEKVASGTWPFAL